MPTLDLLKVQIRAIRLHANPQKRERFLVALAATERISCWLATVARACDAERHGIAQRLWQQKIAGPRVSRLPLRYQSGA
jgi:hypothetical protein